VLEYGYSVPLEASGFETKVAGTWLRAGYEGESGWIRSRWT